MRRSVRAVAAVVLAVAVAVGWSAGGEAPATAAEATFRFAGEDLQAAEGQPMVRVVVERTDLPVSRHVVEYRTESGTAKAGSDFVEATGSLVFDVGQTANSFAVFLRDDAVAEEREYFVVELVRGASASTMVSVFDDDGEVAASPPSPSPAPAPASTAAPGAGAATGATAPAPAAAAGRRPVASPRRGGASVTASPRRLNVRQSRVTPFELRPAGPGPAPSGGEPTAIDPLLAVGAGLLLARVSAEAWFRARTLIA